MHDTSSCCESQRVLNDIVSMNISLEDVCSALAFCQGLAFYLCVSALMMKR